jgi:hypothetical protein
MAYTLTNPPSEKCDLTPKNRVWGFFENSNRTRPANRRQPLELRRKNRLTPTKTASGIPYWPSRDPIEEDGGLNLYGFVGNNGLSYIEILGLSWFDWLGDELHYTFGRIPDPINEFVGTSEFLYDQINQIGESMGEGYANSHCEPCEENTNTKKVITLDIGQTIQMPLGGHFSIQAVAFPDDCKVYFYALAPVAMDTGALSDLRLQTDISANAFEAALGVAYWNGPGSPMPEDFAGAFYGFTFSASLPGKKASAGATGFGSVSGGFFADPLNLWSGYSMGVGIGGSGLPASISSTPDYYTLILDKSGAPLSSNLPKDLCKKLRCFDPLGSALNSTL